MQVFNTLLVLLLALVLASCTSNTPPHHVASNFIHKQKIVATTNDNYPSKDPKKIAVYHKNQQPHMPYKVIGIATVAKKNILGKEREDETINLMMKKLAASIGGDGLMNVDIKGDEVVAHVIAYQRILI